MKIDDLKGCFANVNDDMLLRENGLLYAENEELKKENQRLNNIIKFLKKYFKEHECYEETELLEQLESRPYDENWNGWKEL